MAFSGAAFEKFSVTAKDSGDSSTQRTVSIKDRLGVGGGGGGSGATVSFGGSHATEPRSMADRLGGGGVGPPPRGGNRYSAHDDRSVPYNDYDRSDRGSYRGGYRGRGGSGGYPNDHWRGGNRGGGGYRGGNRGRGGPPNQRGGGYRTDNRNYRGNNRGGPRGNHHDNRGYEGLRRDGDVQMNSLDSDSRGRPTQHRLPQNQPKNYGPNAMNRWHKVRLRNTKDKGYQKEDIVRFFSEALDTKFHAINYVAEETSILFWVQGDPLADSFKAINKRETLPDGNKVDLHVLADHQSPPMADVGDAAVVNALKEVLNTRYALETQALDLSEFDKNEILRSLGYYIPLTKFATLSALAEVIKNAGVEVKALSLRGNGLLHLNDVAKTFGGGHPFNVEILHLGENLLKTFAELDKITFWSLKELILEGNLIREYVDKREREVKVTAVRKRFPKLKKLDDEEMPVEIGFELESEEETKKLPPTQKLYSSSPEALELIRNFLQHYFEFYDKNKQELLPAYHPNSVFSLSAVYNKAIPTKQPNLEPYLKSQNSRNLKYNNWKDEQPAVKTEPLNIVAFLNNLPKTEHDPSSLTIDTGFVSPALLTFVVTGIFRELPSSRSSSQAPSHSLIRSFSRSFVTIPVGTGMQIINDQLTITNATEAQIRLAFKEPVAPPPVPAAVIPSGLTPEQQVINALTAEQQAALVEFMQQTNLVEKFALDALSSAGWSLDGARNLFNQLKDKIPPEGFRVIV